MFYPLSQQAHWQFLCLYWSVAPYFYIFPITLLSPMLIPKPCSHPQYFIQLLQFLCCFGSLFWLLEVLIGSLFHEKLGPCLVPISKLGGPCKFRERSHSQYFIQLFQVPVLSFLILLFLFVRRHTRIREAEVHCAR